MTHPSLHIDWNAEIPNEVHKPVRDIDQAARALSQKVSTGLGIFAVKDTLPVVNLPLANMLSGGLASHGI